MAVNGGKSEADKNTTAYLDFASQLARRLESGNVNVVTMQELEHILARNSTRPPAAKAAAFDRLGTEIWNAAIRLKDQSSPLLKTWPLLEPQLRVLSFFLLDTAQRSYVKHGSKSSAQNLVRIFKTALKAARICIAANALDLCTRLFEKVAEYVEHKHEPPREHKKSEAEGMITELAADYHLLRATVAWKQDKPDSVSFWLARVLHHPNRADMVHLAEKKADLTYEVGKAALKKKQFDSAVRWLEQSHEVFEDFDPEMLSSELCDLRLVVRLDLIRALVGVADATSLEKASSLVVMLDQENGFRTEVYLLRLDIIFAQTPFQPEEFCGEGTFKSIMYQIQKLNTFDIGSEGTNRTVVINSNPSPHSHLACQNLSLLLSRLLAESPVTQKSVEKVVVTRIWIASLSLHVQYHPSELEIIFDDVANTKDMKMSPEAAHASQSLLWKAVTAFQQLENEDEAAKWCKLASHDIFESSGEINKAKLSRKMMTVALAKGDAASARKAYYQMPDSGKHAAMTQYLMYKIALQEGDTELVLEFYERNPSSNVKLPVLLRCIIGSMETELNQGDMPLDAGLTELCKVFEAAMRHGIGFKNADDDDSHITELRWFACHSYNTALKYCSDMHPELLLRFMMASVALIDLLRQENGKEDGLLNRLLLCRFLAASTLIVLARSEDNIERALQLFLDARRQIETFHLKYQEAIQSKSLQPDVTSDLDIKEFEMIKFDLEALMRLENWNDLDKTLSMCLSPTHSNRLESAADLILHIHTHITSSCQLSPSISTLLAKIPTVMEKIINACYRNNKDITRLARWIRCLFQMCLSSNPALSLRCLDQAASIATKASVALEKYPQEEIEWLVTTAFNHAVDLWFGDEDEGEREAESWAQKALMLAGRIGGVGVGGLHKVLQDKWMKLKGLMRD
ncbi:hypothetical protein E4T38_03634 [Aureobasidium subglaciale]|nr:hypothetical protein E4T38_03634 [Aureobasidium subglaciale]KAI5225673.1 hypothetical protein E4T40_03409 [Aureobasidium subglaciale]KAI5229174.1 hypothetical protein E4T41_03527 [Aureobasidium subglaciale]KAI5263890.1 hypothetical protein E4T46_03408 [Aureobasidium subglaciale]